MTGFIVFLGTTSYCDVGDESYGATYGASSSTYAYDAF